MYDVDVLIVGAGPTGLMLANELAAFDVSLRIVDKAPVRSDKSRAIVVQSRGLELLERHGLGRTLVKRGTVGEGIDIHVYGRHAASLNMRDFDFKDTAFSDTLLASQADTEDLLEKHLLQQLGPDHRGVERPATIRSIVADEEGVSVELVKGESDGERSEDTEKLRCRYVVGCDGAHSSVRHAADISFEGDAYMQTFMLCDTHIRNWDDRPKGRTQMFWDKGFMTLLPYAESKGIVRIIACRPLAADADAETRAQQEQPTLETFQQFFADTAHFHGSGSQEMPTLCDPVWVTAFRLHHRVAGAYQSGRLLLAGDAAHIHSPAGGQGMNTGLGDAANLGWKLAAAVRAARSDSTPRPSSKTTTKTLGITNTLLSSYNAERRPVGVRLLSTTDKMFVAATTATPFFAWLRNTVLRFVAPLVVRVRRRREQIIGSMNQLRVRYRRSPVVGAGPGWKGVVRGGDRAPDGKVVAVGGDAADEQVSHLLEHLWKGGKGITSYHLLLFTGTPSSSFFSSAASKSASASATTKSILAATERASSTLTPAGLDATITHIVAGSPSQAEAFVEAEQQSVFVDKDAYLHGRYGFGTRPGYALVRPDGHVEHVGWLSSLPQLSAWVDDRGAAEAATKASRPWWKLW